MSAKKPLEPFMTMALDELNDFVESWEKKPFRVDQEKLVDVVNGLRKGDISDCKAPSITHVAELLHMILSTYVMKSDVFDQAISAYAHEYRRCRLQQIEEHLQSFANREGFGDEFEKAAKASENPKMKDYHLSVVEMLMKSHKVGQHQAINMFAEAAGLDLDNLRRTVNRQKKNR